MRCVCCVVTRYRLRAPILIFETRPLDFHILRASGISTPRESVVQAAISFQAAISYDVMGLFLISKEEDLVWIRGVRFGFGMVGNTYLCHKPRCWTPSLLLCGLSSSTPLTMLRLCLCLCLCPLFPSAIIMDTTARWRDLLNTTHSVPLVQLLGTAALTTVEEIDLYFCFCFCLAIPPSNSCLAQGDAFSTASRNGLSQSG